MPWVNGVLTQSGGSKRHVRYIMHELATKVPRIRKLGGQVSRLTRAGGASAHKDGRAIDIYLDASDPTDLVLADKLCELFRWNAIELQIDNYIWNGHIWGRTDPIRGGEDRVYSGNNDARGPHRDHIHVEFKSGNLDSLPVDFIRYVVVPVHEYMATRDWNAPVSGKGSWDSTNPALWIPVSVR
jgi:hypothetical protein